MGAAVASFAVPCPVPVTTPDVRLPGRRPGPVIVVTTTPGPVIVVTTTPGPTIAVGAPGGTGSDVTATTTGGPPPRPSVLVAPLLGGTSAAPEPTTAVATPAPPATSPPAAAAPGTTSVVSPIADDPGGESSATAVLARLAGGLGLLGLVALLLWRFLARRRPLPPSPWGEVVWRRSHLQLSPATVVAGSLVDVTVFADAAALADQFPASAASRSGGPQEGRGRLVVHVRLLCSTDLAEVESPGYTSLFVERGAKRSTDATFTVRIDPTAPDGSVLRLTALFSHNNRPCGYLYADVPIHATAPTGSPLAPSEAHGFGLGGLAGTSELVPAPTGPAAAVPAILRIEPGATAPDVLVRVTATQANDGRSFLCEVIVRFDDDDDDAHAHEPEPWNLPDTSPRLVAALMDEFTAEDMTPRHRRDTLVGAGAELFDVAPANFKRALWDLVDGASPPRSIFVCTEEPAIPWELMSPYRETQAGTEYRQPLGVEFLFGRWVGDPSSDPRLGNPHLAPLQIGPLGGSVVIAPEYTSGDLVLERAPAEVELVMGAFPGTRVAPALYDRIDAGLGATDAGLLHFVGHGRAEPQGPHVLVLEKDETLSSTALRGMEGARSFGRRCHPVVFLNGCEVGRLKPALAGADGFAKTLIRQGARCVIAPLWSVTDTVAHEVAVEFYGRHARHPDEPLGQVFKRIRSRAYEPDGGQDSYAAYAFFGDPLSRAGT